MPDLDIPIKRLMQNRIEDWLKYLFPELRNSPFDVQKIKTAYVPKAKRESRLDELTEVKTEKENYIFNFEPQGYKDNAMPARMMRYRADITEFYMTNNMELKSIKQVLLLIFPEDDNNNHRIEDYLGDEKMVDYRYKVLRAWEMDRDEVIRNKLISLYPLLPFMQAKPEDIPEEVLRVTINTINTVQERPLKDDLLATASILAEKKFTSTLVLKLIRREMLMESQVLKEWTKLEREEAAAEATAAAAAAAAATAATVAIQNSQSLLTDLIEEKFGPVPGRITETIYKTHALLVQTLPEILFFL